MAKFVFGIGQETNFHIRFVFRKEYSQIHLMPKNRFSLFIGWSTVFEQSSNTRCSTRVIKRQRPWGNLACHRFLCPKSQSLEQNISSLHHGTTALQKHKVSMFFSSAFIWSVVTLLSIWFFVKRLELDAEGIVRFTQGESSLRDPIPYNRSQEIVTW